MFHKRHFTLAAQLLLFQFLISGSNLFGQLTVSPSSDANMLAQNIIGNGMVIVNPTLVCPQDGAGTFNGTNSNIGLSSGVLLTSGNVAIAIGANDNQSAGANGGLTTNQDADLEAMIAPYSVCDNCVLEFEFRPNGDTLLFTFVFASEEYPEYFCSQFNDVFGFFITGPNPAGGSYTAENVGFIPGSNLPVSINNVGPAACNDIDNSSLYVDNNGGTSVQYDGFTVSLTSKVPVIPNENYIFKFAIADAGDCIFDSGIFLEQRCFSSFGSDGNDLIVTDNFANGIYSAYQSVSTLGSVVVSDDATFLADDSIVLSPGFEVPVNAEFEAKIVSDTQ